MSARRSRTGRARFRTSAWPSLRGSANGSTFLDYFRSFYGPTAHLAYSLTKGFSLSAVTLAATFGLLRYSLYRARRTGILLRLSE